MNCVNCNAPKRKIYGPYKTRPNEELITVMTGNWVKLLKCPKCNQLWCSVHYEPHGSFEYLILWDYSAVDWNDLYNIDQGETLSKWHRQSINKLWKTLPLDEQKVIHFHRSRSFGHNPIDIEEGLDPVNLGELILRNQLKQMFFKYLDDQIEITEVLNFIFENDEFTKIISPNDYEKLFSINSNQLGNRHDLSIILFNYFSVSEYETRSLINKLNEAINNPDQLPYILRSFYNFYSSGYFFLGELGLVWGLTHEVEVWENLNDITKEVWLKVNVPKIQKSIYIVLDWITEKKIVLLDVYNEYNLLKYIDYRNKDDKPNKNKNNHQNPNNKNEIIPYKNYKQYQKKLMIHFSISITLVYSLGMFLVFLIMIAFLDNDRFKIDSLLMVFMICLLSGILFTAIFLPLTLCKVKKKINNAYSHAIKDVIEDDHYLITLNNKTVGVFYLRQFSLHFNVYCKNNTIKQLIIPYTQLESIEIIENSNKLLFKLLTGIKSNYLIHIKTSQKTYVSSIPAININYTEITQLINSYIPFLQNEYKDMFK